MDRKIGYMLVALLSVVGCRKYEQLRRPVFPKGKITVSEQVAGVNIFNYYGRNEKYNTVDTLVSDTVFHLFKDANGRYYDNGIRLFFKAGFDTGYATSVEWRIGNDNTVRRDKAFFLDFDRPYGNI